MSSQRNLIPLPRYLGLRWVAFLVAVAILAWMCAPSSRKLAKRLLAAGEARQGAVLLRNALTVSDDKYTRAEIHEELASVEILLGHPKEAIKNQEMSVDLAPDSIKGLARLAEYYDLFCQPEEAAKALTRAMTLYRSWAANNRPEILDLTRGLEVLGPGDLPSLDVLKKRFQEWFKAHRMKLAWYQRWFQQLDAAILTHRELVRDYPEDFDTLAALARLESYAAHGPEAEAALEKMKKMRPNQKDIRDLLAYRYQWNRKPEKVVEEMSAAKLGRDETRRRVLTSYVQAGRGKEGLDEYMRRYPDDKDIRGLNLLLSEIMQEEGELAASQAVLTELATLFPEDDEIAESLADAQSRNRDFTGAAETYIALSTRHPEDDKYIRWAIDAMDATGDPRAALSQLEKLQKRHPEDPSLQRELGIRYVQLGKFPPAVPLLEGYVAGHAEDQAALYHLGVALGETGKSEQAVVIYDKLIKLRGNLPPPKPLPPPTVEYPQFEKEIPVGPVSRKVLALYKKSEGDSPERNRIHYWAELVLNQLGLAVEYRAAEDPLPDDAEMQQYRGIVTWFHDDRMPNGEPFVRWLADQMFRGRPLVALERFGCTVDARDGKPVPALAMERLYRAMGLRFGGQGTENPIQIEVVKSDAAMAEYERPLAYETDYFVELHSVNPENTVHLTLKRKDRENATCDAIVTGPGGAYVLATYAMFEDSEAYQRQWRVNPFLLFEKAFRLAGLPRLDYTTQDGLRMFYTHVDGDGSDGLCRWDPPKTCAEVFHEQLLGERAWPMTVSFIAALVDPALHVGDAAIDAAKRIMYHPLVETAHHTYSHPLDWTSDKVVLKVYGYTKTDMKKEVVTARDVVNKNVCPPDKPVDLCLWSGSCNPPRSALEFCESSKQLNLNGGDPRLDGNNPSIANLAPLYRNVGGLYQYLTSGPNDFFLTDRWTLPSSAFRNVIQTFQETEAGFNKKREPRRLLPVNLYFHFYILSELGGKEALFETLDWIKKQELHPVTVKDYVRIVQGVRTGRIENLGGRRWAVSNAGGCRTVRFDLEVEGVDVARSKGVLGFNRSATGLYVHLDGSERAEIQLGFPTPGTPYLESSTAAVRKLEVTPDGLKATLSGHGKHTIKIAGLGGDVSAFPVELSGTATIDLKPHLERKQ